MQYLLILIYIILTTSGLVFMKLGGNSIFLSLSKNFNFQIGYLTLTGFLLYICSFLLWRKLLVTFNLSYIVPLTTALIQIVVIALSVAIFHEQIKSINLIGILFLIIGVILVSIK